MAESRKNQDSKPPLALNRTGGRARHVSDIGSRELVALLVSDREYSVSRGIPPAEGRPLTKKCPISTQSFCRVDEGAAFSTAKIILYD